VPSVWRRARRDPPHDHAPAIGFAWRAHAAIQDWTRNVDQKASITLVFSTALSAVAAREVLTKDGGLYATAGLKLWLVRAIGVLFALSALLALSVVLPRLRGRLAKAESRAGLIYFGHLRHRTTEDIFQALRTLDDAEALHQLALQLQVTSAIAWRKHQRLRASLVFLVLAATCLAVARLIL
jgi:hypothetical protein